ncbi:hypothetical protein CLV28_2351 [Sediminihabitans luteus]|uniref:DUF4352 domain-containing protein n=1 Tax=Sediminihabitans luteus TaxID=1138585 RepID=A0A2M9CDC9_9CELL|nr:hypothetical protein [Sediminihabitans luteus]PJJ69875.1 hypothetical protein CLV28_2351 [Sediminihabitans luteus]GII99194.1 hypothetical protein Slu03_15720 [Sediminihabitans luteus]
MADSSPDGTDEGSSSRRQRMVLVVAALAAVVVLVLLAVWIFGGGDDDAPADGPSGGTTVGVPTSAASDGASAATESSADESDDSVGPSAEPTSDAAAGPASDAPVAQELDPVEPTDTATGEDGVTAALTKVEAVDGEAVAPGEISGPAVRLTVEVTNGSDEDLDLSGAVVNAYVGPDRAPAGTLTKPGGVPFEGVVAPGESGSAVVLFDIPEEQRGDVTVTVDYRTGTPTVAFRGDLSISG